MLSAATDLMQAEHTSALPAGVVLVADILPALLVQAAAPFFMQSIPYSARIIFCVITAVGSFLVPAFFLDPWVKLIGAILASISCGLGEITFLALTSFYHK
jgi:battenin